MSYQLTGKIKEIFETKQISDSFKVREFVVTTEDGKYQQHVKLQAVNDKCEQLSTFAIGNDVTVSFNLKGRESNKDGKVNYWNSLDAWRIEAATAGAPAPGAELPPNQAPVDVSNGGQEDDLPF